MKKCYQCSHEMTDANAGRLADLIDNMMGQLKEPWATKLGDELVCGSVRPESIDDQERVLWCLDCTVGKIRSALTTPSNPL